MRALLSKWGNSRAIRTPKALAVSARLREDDEVELQSPCRGEIVIRRRKDLEQLVNDITLENRHEATDWGPHIGKELW